MSKFKPSKRKQITTVVCIVPYGVIHRPPGQPIYQPSTIRRPKYLGAMSLLSALFLGIVAVGYIFFQSEPQRPWSTQAKFLDIPACPPSSIREDISSLDGFKVYTTCTDQFGTPELRWFRDAIGFHWVVRKLDLAYWGLETTLKSYVGYGMVRRLEGIPITREEFYFMREPDRYAVCALWNGVAYKCESDSHLYYMWPKALQALDDMNAVKELRQVENNQRYRNHDSINFRGSK